MKTSSTTLTLMRPLSEQPKLGQLVRVFQVDGMEREANCCMVNQGQNRYLQWYDTVTRESIDITQIKGWMPVVGGEGSVDKLLDRFGVTNEELRAKIKPLAILMFDHGITTINIERSGTKALITVDGNDI